MDIVTKDFPVSAGDPTDEYPHGTFEVVLSAPTLDRDGEVVDSKAFEPLPAHITFDTDHSMTCDSVVGSGVPSYADDGRLLVKGGYASDERSQTIRQKVADGHIRTTSVTFMAAEREKDAKGVPHVVKAELLNGTFTPVPSNRESVVLSAKSILAHDLTAKATAKEKSLIQTAHDTITALGASCDMKAATVAPKNMPVEAKSIVGSLEAQRDRAADALEDAYPDAWPYLRGVLPDSLVFDVWTQGECETWQQTYTDDGAVVTLTGEPTEVDVMEVVVADADAFREKSAPKNSDTKQSADTAADSAAKAAELTAKSTDEGSVERAALAHLQHLAALQMGF